MLQKNPPRAETPVYLEKDEPTEPDMPRKEIRTGIFARIRNGSKYYGQIVGAFEVEIYSDGEYIVHGEGQRYRLVDVDLFWSNGSELFPVQKQWETAK